MRRVVESLMAALVELPYHELHGGNDGVASGVTFGTCEVHLWCRHGLAEMMRSLTTDLLNSSN